MTHPHLKMIIALAGCLWIASLNGLLAQSAQGAKGSPSMDFQATPPPKLFPVEPVDGKASGMSGALPEGWRDDSAWADVSGTYAPEEFEGTRYLRVDLKSVNRGAAQIVAPFPQAQAGTAYEIRLGVRAPARPVSFTLQIRQEGAPFTSYWKEQVRAAANQFEEITVQTSVLPQMDKPLFMVTMENAGVLDFRNLTIAPVQAGANTQKTVQATGDGPTNLLRISRFPLGPQTGMSLYREVSDETCVFAADPNVWGPYGSPALRVSSGENKKFHFDGELINRLGRGQPHTASVWIKGDGTLILSAMSAREGNTRVEKERLFRIRPQHGWQRAILNFTAAGDTPNQFLRFSVKGDIWMDGMMVTAGEEAVPFASQGAAEVALALPESAASIAGVQFEEEPARLTWAALGAPAGSTLRTQITTAAGAQAELPPLALSGAYHQTGELDFGVIEGQPLGAFRINSAVFDASGEQISAWSERIVLRAKKPRYWGQSAPASPFGQHIRPAKRHIIMAKALGNNWTRLHNDGAHITDWAFLEPEPGTWNWSDDDLQRYLDGNLMVLGQFSTAPRWASYLADTGVSGDGGYFGKYFLPKDLNQYAAYVTKLAERYKGKITAYEVWNEPWQVRWFGVSYVEEEGRRRIVSPPDAPKRYAELCRVAYKAAKAVDPTIQVVGLNSTSTEKGKPGPDGYMDGKTWSAEVIKAGGLEWSDVVSYHTYDANANGFPGDAVTKGVEIAVGPNDRFPRIDKPVWMSEGAPTVGGRLRFGLYQHLLPYRNPEDNIAIAETVLRYDLSMLANGVEKIFLYSMGDQEQGQAGSYRSGVTMSGSAHPSALGRATLAWHVEGLQFVRQAEVSPGVHGFFFEGDDRSVAVLAPRPDHAPWTLPNDSALEIRDIWNNLQPSGTPLDKETLLVSFQGKAEALQAKLK